MIGPSGLAPLALHQLAAWQRLAQEWPLVIAERDTPGDTGPLRIHAHLTCTSCEASIFTLHDGTAGYMVTPQMITDATVRHLRARHADMEPAGL